MALRPSLIAAGSLPFGPKSMAADVSWSIWIGGLSLAPIHLIGAVAGESYRTEEHLVAAVGFALWYLPIGGMMLYDRVQARALDSRTATPSNSKIDGVSSMVWLGIGVGAIVAVPVAAMALSGTANPDAVPAILVAWAFIGLGISACVEVGRALLFGAESPWFF